MVIRYVVRHDDLVAARHLFGVLALLLGRGQGSLPREYRHYILARGRGIHVEARGAEYEIDLLLQRFRLALGHGTLYVGGAHDHLVVPRQAKSTRPSEVLGTMMA